MNRGRGERGKGRGRGRGKKNTNTTATHEDVGDLNDLINGGGSSNQPRQDNNSDDDDDDINDRVAELSLVSLLFVDKKLGFACYKELTNEIICDTLEANLESIEEALLNIKIFCSPTLFLLHPNIISNSHLLQLVLTDSNGNPQAYRYKAMKTSAWNAESALEMMQSKLIIKDSENRKIGGLKGQKNYLKLASLIDLDNPILRQAVGSLMTFMQSTIFHLDQGLIYISNISALPVTSYMYLDSSTIKALQIFSEEKHPNVIRGMGRSKEGFSVFSLFDKTKSLPGRERLKNWLKLPFCDVERIKQRQNGVSLVMRAENRDFISSVNKHMHRIHDIPRLLLRIKKAEAKCNDWIKLYTSLNSAIPIIELMISFLRDNDKNVHDKAYIENILGMLGTQDGFTIVLTIFDQLKESIDFESSQTSGDVLIACGFDQQLDNFRRTYDSLEFQLTEAAHRVLEMIPLLETVSVEYIPQIGYLIAVREEDMHLLTQYERHENSMNSDRQNNDDCLDFSYSQGGYSYYKHQIVLEMDDSIGDITNLISDRQKNLLRMVEEQLLDSESSLQDISIVLSSLDAIVSLGTIAFEYDFVKPEIVNENVIVIKNGRHPLQCISVPSFVPNDTYISPDKNIAVITGPNSSGKSVYIKQVGLLVYLAHLGSFLPAEKAIIGITDKILTRITSQESVSSPQSAFTLDLCQMSKIIRSHTPRTLCLIDEFGKGTTPVDGIALLATCIKRFVQQKAKVFFVVHFTEVLHKDIIDCTLENSITPFRMEMLTEKNSQGSNDLAEVDATPLFALKLGVAPSSEGLACARAAGMRSSILQRASNIKDAMTNKGPVRPIQRSNNLSTNLVKLFLQYEDWNVIENDGDGASDEVFQNLKLMINQN